MSSFLIKRLFVVVGIPCCMGGRGQEDVYCEKCGVFFPSCKVINVSIGGCMVKN